MERILVSAGIRLIGLWWILFEGGSSLYYIIIKHAGLLTTSNVPVAYNEQSAIFNVAFGAVIVLLAPIITLIIFGVEKQRQNPPPAL